MKIKTQNNELSLFLIDWRRIHKTLFTSKLKICQGKRTPEKTMDTPFFDRNIYSSIVNRCASTRTVHCKSLRNEHHKTLIKETL